VAASLAPSFASIFSEWQTRRLASALRKLGFAHVSETAVGAYDVAQQTARYAREHRDRACIATACPAVVHYVERYRPHLVRNLVPIVSPMVAHARKLKQVLGEDAAVVFIGPCVAKKAEAEDKSDGLVDCALTFTELLEWFDEQGIDLAQLEESDFDLQPAGWARSFPLVGGSLETASLRVSALAPDVVSVAGAEEVADVLDSLAEACEPVLIEALFCEQGCINGPAMPATHPVHERRTRLLRYVLGHTMQESGSECSADLGTTFAVRSLRRRCGPAAHRTGYGRDRLRRHRLRDAGIHRGNVACLAFAVAAARGVLVAAGVFESGRHAPDVARSFSAVCRRFRGPGPERRRSHDSDIRRPGADPRRAQQCDDLAESAAGGGPFGRPAVELFPWPR